MRVIDPHHLLTISHISLAALEIVGCLPETDVIRELAELLEELFDVIDSVLNDRHFGSDALDHILLKCQKIIQQVQEYEK
jgi:hypothetical protein